ncbi:MAG: thioredoxin [Nitrospirae bacterium]|nr:thioredoxin [Nitrospirota bacterium]
MDNTKPVDVTDATFDELVLESGLPVVLEFWSPLCVHCQKMAHVVDALAEELAGRAVVAKVNILENTDTPPKYGVTGIPAFFLIKGGEVAAKTLGAMPKGRLKADLGL